MPEAAVAGDWAIRGGLLVEPRLAARGFRHGMTTRAMGDMADPARRAAVGSVVVLRQVHGTDIHVARAGMAPRSGDGLVSRASGPAVGVFSADCVPILLWTEDGSAVGAFHGGWRGLAAGMGRAAVAAMGRARDLHAAVGPHIGSCCYRVGPELRDRFPADRFEERGGGLHLDLGAEARAQLAETGVSDERIAVSALCTACRPELSSWRRDRVRLNMLTFISPL